MSYEKHSKQDGYILVDGHVHFYSCFREEIFLNAGLKNFERRAQRYAAVEQCYPVLALTESFRDNWFNSLEERLGSAEAALAGDGQLQSTKEAASLRIQFPSLSIVIIAGRQVISREGLKVLALGTRSRFEDGQPVEQLLEKIWAEGAVGGLPWGGKMVGQTGQDC